MVEPTNVANLWVNKRSQINEDTVKPSLAAQDINPIAYAPDIIFAPRSGFVPGSVQLIRPVRVLSLAVAHSTARPVCNGSSLLDLLGVSRFRDRDLLSVLRIFRRFSCMYSLCIVL